MNDIKPIRTEADYQAALSRVRDLMQATAGTPELDELDILVILIEAYEAQYHSMDDLPDSSNLRIGKGGLPEVWIFHGAGSRFGNGVFASRAQAEEFIRRYQLAGTLTAYPIGIGIYEWVIQENLFQPKTPAQYQAEFIQRFTAASQEHYHYDAEDFGLPHSA